MSNRDTDLKISDMEGVTALSDSDLLTVVSGGTNKKMTVAEFKEELGVTGTIVQDGAVTGIGILDTQGTVHNIRNVEAGAGISASVSAENGLALKHNFEQDVVGVPVLRNPTAAQPTIASLEAGPGINISADENHIEISTSGITASTKTTVVNELEDLPTEIGGVITLVDDTEYLFVQDIDFSTTRIVINGGTTTIRGAESTLITLTYSGTGDFITVTDATARVSNCSLSCVSGRVFNWTNTTTGNIFRCNDVSFTCDRLGVFNSASTGIVRFTNASGTVTTDGIEFVGSFLSFLWEVSALTTNGGSSFDLGTATFESFIVATILASTGVGASFITGLAAGANITATGTGSVQSCRFSGLGTILTGVAVGDPKWQFRVNDDLFDTFADNALFQGNLTISNAEDTGILVDPASPSFGWRDIEGHVAYTGSGASSPQLTTFQGNQRLYLFDTTARRAQFVYHIPHDYVKGTDIFFHVHWAHNSGTITTGSLNWSANISYSKGHNQEPFGADVTNIFGEAASLVQYQHMVTETQASVSGGSASQIDTDLLEPDGVVVVNLQMSSNSMDGGAQPYIVTADIHYQTSNIATKNKAPNFYA